MFKFALIRYKTKVNEHSNWAEVLIHDLETIEGTPYHAFGRYYHWFLPLVFVCVHYIKMLVSIAQHFQNFPR